MRVLLVSDFYPPTIGGMERHVQALGRELVRRGHSVAAASSTVGRALRSECDEGVRVYRVDGTSRVLTRFYGDPQRPFPLTVPDPLLARGLQKVIRDEKPDVVNGQGWIIYSALAALGKAGPPIVVTLHDYGLMCAKRTFMHGDQTCNGPGLGKCVRCAGHDMGAAKALAVASGLRVSRGLHARVDRFIAVSQAVADASAPYIFGAAGRIHVLPSFVSDSVMKDAPSAPRPAFVPACGEYLLFVGSLARNKGVDVLLDAHKRMSPRPHLVIIATPPVRHDVEVPDNVTLVSGVEHVEVMGAWAHCALGVVPSRWPEPFGQVAVEAMVCGKAVVASNIGGLADIVIHGETGLLVTPGDADELRSAIEQLLRHRACSRRMGAAGRTRAGTFVASRVTEDVEALFTDVVRSRA